MEILTGNTFKAIVPAPANNAPRSPVAAVSAPAAKSVAPTTTPPPSSTATYQLEQVQHALQQLKQSIKPALANTLQFEIDQSTGKTLVKIMDVETSRLIRQIPSEEMLIIARALERMQGQGGLVEQQA